LPFSQETQKERRVFVPDTRNESEICWDSPELRSIVTVYVPVSLAFFVQESLIVSVPQTEKEEIAREIPPLKQPKALGAFNEDL
jgi:hypothetical protein